MTSLVKPLVLSSFPDRDKGRMTGIPPFAVEMIEKHFRIVWIEDFNANPEKYGKEVVAVFMGTKQPTVDKDLLEKLPNLKIVASMSAGYNHLDIPLIRSYGVRVSNTPYVLDNATADLGMALLLNAGRELYSNINFAMSPGTTHFDMNLMSGDVSGTTLGIVGMGRIGCKVAERARAFNMNILYHNRSKRNDDSAIGATYYSKLNDMLPHCDHIIITLPLTAETNKIIGAQQFKLMKSTSILINIARGGIVDHDALVHALTHREIKFAALDVTDPEPLPRDHPLLKMKNVIITSHIGSATFNTRRAMAQKTLDNIAAAIAGSPLPSEVLA